MNIVSFGYLLIALFFGIFSYGFIDPNLHLSYHPMFVWVTDPVIFLVYKNSLIASMLYVLLLTGLYALYARTMYLVRFGKVGKMGVFAVLAGLLFWLSYPALSYDIYNYILTAKVAFFYHENPYVVMPIEFIGEPMLAFTRAANKLALYGPVWIASTYIPHVLSGNNFIIALFAFKLLSVFGYVGLVYLIYQKTRRLEQVLFFALNPLVIIEIFTSGHNDAFMMFLAFSGVLALQKRTLLGYVGGTALLFGSILVKGATVVIVPVMIWLHKRTFEMQMKWIAALLFGVFLLSPLREEMYPWYALWWLGALAFIPIRHGSVVHGASFWLSFGLMARYIPWIATREYGGYGPMIRTLVTVTPMIIYLVVITIARLKKKK